MEYLYKVMKKKFYERALQFGDLYFQSTFHLDKCTSYNKDVNENKTEVIEHFNVDDFPVEYSSGIYCFSYCFTMDINKYLAKYQLANDYVILRFSFEDVVNFFNSLALRNLAYGKISYQSGEPILAYKDSSNLTNIEKSCIMQHFIKSKNYELESEFRFVCLPLYRDYMMYYSPLNDILIGISDEQHYTYKDLFVRLVPLLEVNGGIILIKKGYTNYGKFFYR